MLCTSKSHPCPLTVHACIPCNNVTSNFESTCYATNSAFVYVKSLNSVCEMLSSVPDSMGVSLGSSVMKSASKLLKSLFPRYSKEDSEWRPGRRELRALRGERRGEERREERGERGGTERKEERGELTTCGLKGGGICLFSNFSQSMVLKKA